jgi:integrase
VRPRGYSEKVFAEQFRAALKAAGIEDYVRPFHDLRHTALTNEAAAGSSPIALMTKAGHTDMKTTRRYLHLAGIVFHDEAAALERRLLGSIDI